ncbi:hypothetical protein VCRA2110O173_670001 [Vibrio crassostreae]|nr:hypothetical protein VCRA2110O173_670001 [Vibrio crassostreae]CAK3463904.1 hypothetical protein VCRA2128O94_570001 [Vibrio crassostreae]
MNTLNCPIAGISKGFYFCVWGVALIAFGVLGDLLAGISQ